MEQNTLASSKWMEPSHRPNNQRLKQAASKTSQASTEAVERPSVQQASKHRGKQASTRAIGRIKSTSIEQELVQLSKPPDVGQASAGASRIEARKSIRSSVKMTKHPMIEATKDRLMIEARGRDGSKQQKHSSDQQHWSKSTHSNGQGIDGTSNRSSNHTQIEASSWRARSIVQASKNIQASTEETERQTVRSSSCWASKQDRSKDAHLIECQDNQASNDWSNKGSTNCQRDQVAAWTARSATSLATRGLFFLFSLFFFLPFSSSSPFFIIAPVLYRIIALGSARETAQKTGVKF
jgi:hypothetical protein